MKTPESNNEDNAEELLFNTNTNTDAKEVNAFDEGAATVCAPMVEAIVEDAVRNDSITARTVEDVEGLWESWFVPGISDFVRVPNLSQNFDSNFKTNGLLEKAMKVVDDYI
jgi:hypothetical protein